MDVYGQRLLDAASEMNTWIDEFDKDEMRTPCDCGTCVRCEFRRAIEVARLREPVYQQQGVVQSWVANYCTLKQQTVLLLALRGCDGVRKEDDSKIITRVLRNSVLRNADATSAFMQLDANAFDFAVGSLVGGEWDQYPLHWVMHMVHACEIIGYKHPDTLMKVSFNAAYLTFCKALHVRPEGEAELDSRLADKTKDKAYPSFQALLDDKEAGHD